MGPLLQSQVEAMGAQKALAQAQAQFGAVRADQNAKSKKFLMTMSSGNKDVLITSCFTSWMQHTKRMKREEEIRIQYAEELDLALKKLSDYKLASIERIRNVLLRDVESGKGALLKVCFNCFKDEVFDEKNKQSMGKSVAQFEAQLGTFASASAANAKALLARMNAGTDEALVAMCFKAFVDFVEDYKKNKEIEDAVKAAEKKVAEFLEQHKEGAKGILARMSAGTDAGLVGSMFKEWRDVVKEEKEGMAMQEALAAKASKFDSFANRNSGTALSEMQRMANVTDMHLVILMHNLWKRELKLEKIKKYGRDRNQKKRNQLVGVKNLFKNFATDLDAGLKGGTPRTQDLAPKKIRAPEDEGVEE